MPEHVTEFLAEASTRLERLAAHADAGGLDDAIDALTSCVAADGVVQAFGTGHSQAFAMEMAGRAGGLIPTNNVALRDIVLFGGEDVSAIFDGKLERDPEVADRLWATIPVSPQDIFVIASNSGVNGSVVGLALKAKEQGHTVIAVTSLAHTAAVTPKHPSGRRLSEIADIVIDNLAPYGDTTLTVEGPGEPTGVGAVSSITAAFVAQLLTLGVTQRLAAAGATPPIYLSANIPGGDDHNHALEDRYAGRIRRHA